MEAFLPKHSHLINASLSCFDRLIFKGYLPLGYESAMEGFLSRRGILLKDFGRFVKQQADLLQMIHNRAARTYSAIQKISFKSQRGGLYPLIFLFINHPCPSMFICG